MISYLVIGICIFLLLVVIYISAKPISMGIEARRNISGDKDSVGEDEEDFKYPENESNNKNNISDEIIRLNQLKKDGLLTDEEYEKAKKKLLA
tara:strand:+ start:142 stop:420 length:279 start_codon:yes stop_codon:yes gene_type:complete